MPGEGNKKRGGETSELVCKTVAGKSATAWQCGNYAKSDADRKSYITSLVTQIKLDKPSRIPSLLT